MSYKIVDQIKKTNMPAPLKKVLEAYASFGNKDGTSIRPTEASVGNRASASRSTISRRTQTLVRDGLLVHDRDEHGIFLKHAYGENGVWAYVYHIDAKKLTDPALVAHWETEREAFIEKCRESGAKNFTTRWAKGTSGNRSGLSKIQRQEQRVLRQTLPEGFATNPPQQNALVGAEGFATQTLPCDPRSADPSDNPSALSRAVSQNQVSELVSEDCSLAPLAHSAGRSKKETTTFEQEKQKAKEEAFAEAMQEDKTPLVKPKYDHDLPLWITAEELFHSLWPKRTIMDEDTELLIDLAMELDGGLDWYESPVGDWHIQVVRGAGILQAAWEWNQIHKKGKYKLFSLAELAKALRSTNDRNLLAQMQAHEGCKLCMDECVVSGCKTLVPKNCKTESAYCDAHLPACSNAKSKGMDNPPVSAPSTGGSSLCPHGNNWGLCQICVDEEAKRNQCQHGNPSATCYKCSHPENAMCRWKECGNWFHAPSKAHRFCSHECENKFTAREEELKKKYARPTPEQENPLMAFLEGRY